MNDYTVNVEVIEQPPQETRTVMVKVIEQPPQEDRVVMVKHIESASQTPIPITVQVLSEQELQKRQEVKL